MFRRVEEEAAAFRREHARGFAPDREDAPYGGKAVSYTHLDVYKRQGESSATGVCFSRDAATGEDLFNGEYLINCLLYTSDNLHSSYFQR